MRCLILSALVPMIFFGCAPTASGTLEVSLLQANIGNSLLSCGDDYVYKLCGVDVEERLGDSVAALTPDLVVLQEVIGREQCAGMVEPDKRRTCHEDVVSVQAAQARRLLGPDYTIVCDQRVGYECIGVHTAFAAVAECGRGEQCYAAATAPQIAGCPIGFSVSSITVQPEGAAPFTLVNGHPDSNPGGECRAAQLAQVFEGTDSLAAADRTLLAGDFNLDPDLDNDPSVSLWVNHVGMTDEGLRFRYHSGHEERSPPYPTSPSVIGDRVIDHVASDFATGACTTLGEAPGTARLDGGEGTDHRALRCALSLPTE